MRMIVVKQDSDLQSLTERLFRGGKTRAGAPLDRLQALNPHVDFKRIGAGTVLLVPDFPDFEGGDSTSVPGEAFDSLAKDTVAGLKAASARMRSGIERQEARRKEVGAVLRSAAFKRLAQADEALKAQAAEAEARIKAESRRAEETAATIAAVERELRAELDALGRVVA